jgi:Flp pilus assembly protein protease CpaA
VNLAFAIGLMALLGIAALSDLRHRRIPNEIPASAALLWLVALALGAAGSPLAGLATGLGLLAAGILAWRLGWLGGGDVKLIAALVVRCRQKIPSGWLASTPNPHRQGPRRGYQPSASHH